MHIVVPRAAIDVVTLVRNVQEEYTQDANDEGDLRVAE